MSRESLKSFLNYAGSFLAAMGIGFLFLRLYENGIEVNFAALDTLSWLYLVSLSLLYGLSNLFLVAAWRQLLKHTGAEVRFLWAIKAYGISQLAKYIPGNIFHLAGRQAIGQSAGLPASALMKSTLLELVMIGCCGACLGLLAIPLALPDIPQATTLILAVLIIILLLFPLRRRLSKTYEIATSIKYQACFLLISGIVFCCVLKLQIGDSSRLMPLEWINIIGIHILAWFVGFATPGSPAGIGIRETVLLVGIPATLVSSADLAMAVLLSRIVNTLGDFAFFLAASATHNTKAQ